LPRIFVIDGLDECHGHDTQCEILDILCRILQNLPIPFAIVIASRPEHHIRGAFDLSNLNRHSFRVSLEDSYNADADIKTFFLYRFRQGEVSKKIRDMGSKYLPVRWPSQGVIDNLVAKASGQFIYASTVDRFISSIRHNPAERLDMLLSNVNVGILNPFEPLDALYSTIFRTVDITDIAGTLRLLGAFMPYSPRFFERLLGLGTGGVRHLLFDLESLLTIDDDDKDFRLFHASLSDYLFNKSRAGQFWIDPGMVHADLAQKCLFWLPEEWRGKYFYITVTYYHTPDLTSTHFCSLS
ncbi:hypothetical protein GALMADRAFT_1340843, partial [Galerina marginata CBS 339.88]